MAGGNGIDLLGSKILGLWLYQLFSYYLLGYSIISEKPANRFLGVGVSLMAAGTVYLHPEASAITFEPFHNLKGLVGMGDLG